MPLCAICTPHPWALCLYVYTIILLLLSTIDTFHVQNVTINSYPNSTMCFVCIPYCFIQYNCLESESSGNVTVNTTECWNSNVTETILCNLFVHDIEYQNGGLTVIEPEVYSTTVEVTRMMSTSSSTKHSSTSTNSSTGEYNWWY